MSLNHPMNEQEREEAEFGYGPRLWDATPGVCCAAYQLGACEHTEVFDPAHDIDVEDVVDGRQSEMLTHRIPAPVGGWGNFDDADEPF